MSLVRSILLCGGRGTRLQPLTDSVPKAALPVLDIPLGAWGLAALGHVGGIVVNVSHLGDAIVGALRPHGDFEVLHESPEPYGTGGTLRALAGRVEDRVVTYNGDLLSDVRVVDLLHTHRDAGCLGTVAVQRVETAADLVEDGKRVTGFIDRRDGSDRSGARFIGVAVWESAALRLLPDRRPSGLGETLLPTLVERGQLAVHVHPGYALDVGTPERYLRANLDVLQRLAPAPPAQPPGTIEGGNYFGPHATASRSRSSVLLAGARARLLERSVVWPNETADEQLVDALWAMGRRVC